MLLDRSQQLRRWIGCLGVHRPRLFRPLFAFCAHGQPQAQLSRVPGRTCLVPSQHTSWGCGAELAGTLHCQMLHNVLTIRFSTKFKLRLRMQGVPERRSHRAAEQPDKPDGPAGQAPCWSPDHRGFERKRARRAPVSSRGLSRALDVQEM